MTKIRNSEYPEVFQTNSKPYGKPYEIWTEDWWKWAFSIPKNQNPIIDKTGENCSKKQKGPVWYLAGTTGVIAHAQRRCEIPHNLGILFPIIVSQYSRSEVPKMTIPELKLFTAKDIDQTSCLDAVVDDVHISNLSKYRIQSSFRLDIVEDNIWGVRPGPTKAVSDGFWVFLKPMPKGKHFIRFQGTEPNFKTRVSYEITIL